MANEQKVGKPWSDDELDEIVSDYFSMLTEELSGHTYVKSHHSYALMESTGRTHRSVEFKHQNISAVLEELGLPWIEGYKPKRNYQAAIFDAIDRYLSRHQDFDARLPAAAFPSLGRATFVEPPGLTELKKRPAQLERLVRKFDPVERDFRNRNLGKAGESFVVELERARLILSDRHDLANNVRWIAQEDGDGAGFDIRSFETDGRERLIEVKTTNGSSRTPFFLTRNEVEVSCELADRWRLYRVHLFARTPRVFTLKPPLTEHFHLVAEAWRASFA